MIAQEPRHGTTEVEHIDVDANQHVYMTFLGGARAGNCRGL